MRFEEKYFVESNYSNYFDYRKKKFTQMVQDLISLGLTYKDEILDFGCATGGLVYELNNHGFMYVVGTDISYWAIDYGREVFGFRPSILQHYNRQLLEGAFTYILMTDVLEHISTEEINLILKKIKAEYIILRVPVAALEGEDYVLEVHKNDKTHVQVHEKSWWNELLARHGFLEDKIIEGKAIFESEGVLARVYKSSLG